MRAGTLIVDIQANVARLQKDMAEAKGAVQGAMGEITRSVNAAKTALIALGGAFSVGQVAQMAMGITRATAALDDMAEVTGTAVEELSKLQVVAKVGGHDFGLIEDSLVKVTKGLKGTEEETKNARNALQQLGIQAKTSSGQQRDAGEIMREVALKFATFRDGADKTAFALDIFGKSGAKLLPFLKDMAEEGTVNARVTAEQAAAAEKLEKNINRLKIAGEDARRDFVLKWIDDLVVFTEKLNDAQKAAGGLAAGLVTMASAGTRDPAGRLAQIDAEIAASEKGSKVADQYGSWWSIGGLMAKAGSLGGKVDVGRLMAEREYLLKRISRNADGLVEDPSGNFLSPPAKPAGLRKPPPSGGAKGKSLADLLNESSGVGKDYYEDLQKLHGGYTAGKISLEQYREAVIKLTEKQSFAKDLARQHTEEIKRQTAESEAAFELEQRRGAQMVEFVGTQSEELRQLEFEVSLIGMTNAEREKAVALRKIENDLKKASKGLTDEETESLRREADVLKERIGTLYDTKAARDAAAQAAEEWKRSQASMWQDIDRVAHDTFVSIFDSGKSAFDRLKDALKNGLYSLLYQMTVRPFIINIAAAISGQGAAQTAFGSTGGGGLGGLLGGGGGGGGGFSPGNLLSLGSNAYQGITGNSLWSSAANALGFGGGATAAGGLGLTSTALAGEAAALGIGSLYGGSALALGGGAAAGIGGIGSIGAGAAAGAGAAGAGAAAAIPYVGWAIAAYALLSSMGGGGGPKTTDGLVGYNKDEGGVLIGVNNGPVGNLNSWAQSVFTADKYDHDKIREILGGYNRPLTGSGPGDISGMQQQAISMFEPARIDVAARSQARTALESSQNPAGFWRGKVAELSGDLGTSVRTIEEWRTAFLAAMDAPLSQANFEKWQQLGAAIEAAGNAAAQAGSQLSTSAFSTLVDYRRAVRLAGGIPQFAGGVENFSGGWAMTGERGPELVRLPAGSSVYSNGDSRRMLDNSGLEARVARLETVMTSVALHTSRTARLMDRWDGEGLPVRGLDPSTPLEVAVAP